MQALDLDAHLGAQLGVEVRQRLVEQKHLRIAHDAAAERDALLLAARQLLRLALQQVVQAEHARGAVDRGLDLGFRGLLVAQAEGEIVVDAHVLVERVVLEHHGDVAVARRQVVDHPVADADVAAGDVLEARDHAQRRRLAAAGRADQGHELLVGDLEIDVLYGVEQRAIMLVELAECDRCHFPAVTLNLDVVYPEKQSRREHRAAGFALFDYCAALLTSGAPSASTFAMSSRLPVTALVTVSLNALCTAGHCGK